MRSDEAFYRLRGSPYLVWSYYGGAYAAGGQLAPVMPPFMPPFMLRVHVLTGGSLIERIYSPAADQLSRERQSDQSWRNDKPKGWPAK